ncbi:MAG: hypothetical protein K2G47_03825 [Muribaculum sp.]|nr:hypothetical protein [Muribaculum sp.]
MKKFYAFAAAVVAALTMNAQTVVTLAGGYNGWSATDNPMTETEAGSGVYELKLDKLTKEFKVVVTETVDDVPVPTWYGVEGGAIELGTPSVLVTGEAGANITFANGWDAISDAVVKFELSTLTLTVTGNEATVEVSYGIHGSFIDPNWATTDLEKAGDNLWVKTFTFEAEAVGEFGIKQMDDAGNQLGWFAATAEGIVIEDEIEDIEIVANGKNLNVALPAGTWTFTFDAEALTLSVTAGEAGIDSVIAEENAAPVYYNLQGVKVANPENGIYVVRQGNKVSKVLVK